MDALMMIENAVDHGVVRLMTSRNELSYQALTVFDKRVIETVSYTHLTLPTKRIV